MKTKTNFTAILVATTLISFNSCKKEEDKPDPASTPKPVVTLTELGLNNTKTGYIGSDLHIEADIVAEGVINTVKIEIHPEGAGATWTFEQTYTEFSGMKNATFHKHIDIPSTATAGEHHFHLIVTDMIGNTTTAESELDIRQPTDAVSPQITVASHPLDSQAFSTGDTIKISGTITDDRSLGGINIALVRTDQSLSDADVTADNTITLLHNHDFPASTSYAFSKEIIVGASTDNDITPDLITWTPGTYYILVKCKDAEGNWTYSTHYIIVIN